MQVLVGKDNKPLANKYIQITGWGKYLPEKVLGNSDLEEMVETSDAWIQTRTGIHQRHIASPDEATSDLAIKAAWSALKLADLNPARLELIILASISPNNIFPATACRVQSALGAFRATAFDISAGCAGFVYALNVASDMLRAGPYRNALVIGAEVMSRFVDWQDRTTCVLFGDGAGAFLLETSDTAGGILSSYMGADGSGADLLLIPAGGSSLPTSEATLHERQHYLHMNGPEIYRFGTRIVGQSAREVLKRAGLPLADVELLIPHQANDRITQAVAKALKIPAERVYSNISRYGNTSSASVPIAFCDALEEGYIKLGDHVILVGFGAGLTWGATLIHWVGRIPRPRPWWRRLLMDIRSFFTTPLFTALRRLLRRLDALIGGLAHPPNSTHPHPQ